MKGTEPSNDKESTRKANHEWPDWHASLAQYREASTSQAVTQLTNTLLPYLALWAVLIILSINDGPKLLISGLLIIAAAFLVRIFILFHDCIHGSLFPAKGANTFFGHFLGLLTFTPFDDWRFSHLRHHATYADLDARGFGDIWTLTNEEYKSMSKPMQLYYRIYRSPSGLIGLGAVIMFILRFRLPTRSSKRKERMSVIFTNLCLIGIVMIAAKTIGWQTYLRIQVPVLWMAGAAGIWLFYVQHQFNGVYWERKKRWNALRAAMEGSSHYDLPPLLRWFSANIGYHHVHHLNSRIPNYRLQECYDAIPELQAKMPLRFRESLGSIKYKIWDEDLNKLVGFPQISKRP